MCQKNSVICVWMLLWFKIKQVNWRVSDKTWCTYDWCVCAGASVSLDLFSYHGNKSGKRSKKLSDRLKNLRTPVPCVFLSVVNRCPQQLPAGPVLRDSATSRQWRRGRYQNSSPYLVLRKVGFISHSFTPTLLCLFTQSATHELLWSDLQMQAILFENSVTCQP